MKSWINLKKNQEVSHCTRNMSESQNVQFYLCVREHICTHSYAAVTFMT